MPDEANSKAKRDLRDVQDSVNKVELARKQLADLLGEDYEGAGAVETTAAMVGAEHIATTEEVVGTQAERPAQVVLPGGQPAPQPMPAYGQPTAQQFVQQPMQTQPLQPAQPIQQPVQQAGAQAPQGQQDGYWRGFQPVQPPQPAQPQAQPMQPPVQPGYTYPAQPQPTQPQVQPGYTYPTQPQPGQVRANTYQPPQLTQPQTQPVQPQQQPMQPAQPQAQPAGYSQIYTPQIQQPAGYVPAQDFAVQPQPVTPAYEKSNKSTLAIVIAVIIGLVSIITAIVLGRILSGTSDHESPLIDQLSDMEQEFGLDSDNYYDDHDWGNGDNGAHNWGFNWDDDQWGDIHDWDQFGGDQDSSSNSQGHGATHVYGGGIDADDGELHDAWNKAVSYSYTESEFDREGIETIDFYNKVIAYDFDVEYPQLTGDIPNLDAINKAIRDKAMRFADMTYNEPTSDARAMLEAYADGASGSVGAGVPNGADAILESDVDYAITFNNDDIISICFSDEYAIGSWYGESITLRSVNVNLKTGEIYDLDDVLVLNDDIAEDFIDNLSTYDKGMAEQAAGRKSFVGAIQGKGSDADNVTSTFFIDGNGKVNLGVSYFLSGNDSVARGWWDYTLTDEQFEAAKKDSPLWDLIAKN